MSIKVTVDFVNGCYNVTGLYNGENFSIHKPIRGIDRDGYYKANYSRKMIANKRKKLDKLVKELIKKDPSLKISRRAIKDVDGLMFEALRDWDKIAGTTYAIDYLKSMIQKFDTKNSPGIPAAMFEEDCKKVRANDLKKLGIDISYSVGMFHTSQALSFWDKVRGIRLAKKQEKFMGAKVMNNFVMERAYYLNDKNKIYKDIPDDFEDIILNETLKQIQDRDESNYLKDSQIREKEEKADEKLQEEIVEEPVEEIKEESKKEQKEVKDNTEELDENDEDYFLDEEDDVKDNVLIDRRINKQYNYHELPKVSNEEYSKEPEKTSEEVEKEPDKSSDVKVEKKVQPIKIDPVKPSEELRRQAEEVEKMSQRAKNVLENAKNEMKKLSNDAKEENKTVKREESNLGEKPLMRYEMQERVVIPTPEPIKVDPKDIKIEVPKVEIKKQEGRAKSEAQARRNRVNTGNPRPTESKKLTRKIDNLEQSIRNKNKKPLKLRVRRKIVRFLLTAFTVGGVALGTYKALDYFDNGTITNRPETEFDAGIDYDDTNDDTPIVVVEPTTEAKTQPQTETQRQTETEPQTQVQTQVQTETETETEPQTIAPVVVDQKTDEEKLEEFRKEAVNKYMNAFILGEKPAVGDMLSDKTYSASPDGTGSTGSFSNYDNYKIEHVVIMNEDKWETVVADGKTLPEILAQYPNRIGYSVHFSNRETGGGLGFVTQAQLEDMINNKVNNIIETKRADILKQMNNKQNNQDTER